MTTIGRRLLWACGGLSSVGIVACSTVWGFDDLTGTELDAASDASSADGSSTDTGSPDAGPDAAPHDSGLDTGSPDAGSPDAGSPDAGSPDAGSPDAGCVPSGTRQPFNAVVSSTTTGCWAGSPCGQDTVVLSPTYGKNFAGFGQELVCGGTTACVGHVGIGTYSSSTCQGVWDVYCNATKVGTINTLNKVCVGTAMTNGCNIAFTPTSCTTLRLVATAGSGQTCCGAGGPDSTITAVSAW